MFRQFLILAASALAVSTGGAFAAEGRFTYENASSAEIVKTTQTGDWSSAPPLRLAPGESGTASARFPDRGVVVNHVSYRAPDSVRSCSFRIQTEPGPVLCDVVAVVVPGGGASCHYRFNARDSQTCAFDLVFTISGF